MAILASLIGWAATIYIYIIVAQVLISWLIAFDVINPNSAQAQSLIRMLKKATDPVYEPLRKYIPPIGGIDITPLIVIIGISIISDVIISILI